MARIDLVEDGFVYSTAFAVLDDKWVFSPDNPQYISIIQGAGLQLAPATYEGTVLALLPQLVQPYVLEAEFEYAPVSVDDSAGFVLWASADSAIYLSLVAGGRQYSRLRLKVKEGRCEGYAYSDDLGAWEVAGTAFVAPDAVPGIFAEGQSPVIVKRVVVARDVNLTVGNLPPDSFVSLYNATGDVIATAQASAGVAVIQLGSLGLLLEVRLGVSVSGELTALTDLVTASGGSVYWYNRHELKLYLDSTPVDPGQELSLGPLVAGVIERRLEIENGETEPVSDIVIRCAAFNVSHGPQWASLAPEFEGAPGQYEDSLYIPVLAPGERVPFWLKVQRPPGLLYYPSTEHRFVLLVTSGAGG